MKQSNATPTGAHDASAGILLMCVREEEEEEEETDSQNQNKTWTGSDLSALPRDVTD